MQQVQKSPGDCDKLKANDSLEEVDTYVSTLKT